MEGRLHQLDALRAFAMFLGVVIHAGRAYTGGVAYLQSEAQFPLLGVVASAIHGFRMQLFFLLAGYFAMLLVVRKGLGGMLANRGKRVAVPLLVACVTILPLMHLIGAWTPGFVGQAKKPSPDSVWLAAQTRNTHAILHLVVDGADVNAPDKEHGLTPAAWAAAVGSDSTLQILLDLGADPNARCSSGRTALHLAAELGRDQPADILLRGGANPNATDDQGRTPIDEIQTDIEATEAMAARLGVRFDAKRVLAGRAMIEQQLRVADGEPVVAWRPPSALSRTATVLMAFRVFFHLWFLWFLCWMTLAFALVLWLLGLVSGAPRADSLRGWWILAWPGALLWLLPLTMLTIAPVAGIGSGLGVPNSVGLLPIPAVFLHYALFFAFGAVAFVRRGTLEQLGRGWTWWLLVSAATFLVATSFTTARPWTLRLVPDPAVHTLLALLFESLYPWAVACALIGLFERMASVDRPWVRSLSDSSYFVYLAHMPLVLALQVLLVRVPAPAPVKFVVVIVVTMVVLLVMYRTLVRGSWVGLMLNGRRVRSGQPGGG